jgi:serine/threonine-protein kinase RsbW
MADGEPGGRNGSRLRSGTGPIGRIDPRSSIASVKMERELVFELPNDLSCIEEAVEFVVHRCSTCEASARKLKLNFRVGLTEALSNAMIYGNGRDPSKRVRVEVFLSRGAVTARVTDQGRGFDPDGVPDPTTPRNLCRVGGRGLFLMRKLLDEVRYNAQGNSVTLVLHLREREALQGEASA